MIKQTFQEFFDMPSKVLTDPPAQGVQGIMIKNDPVASPEKRGEPIVDKKAKGDVPIKGGPKLSDTIQKVAYTQIGRFKFKALNEEDMTGLDGEMGDWDGPDGAIADNAPDEEFAPEDKDIEGLESNEVQDQGTVRTVAGAHLVYKRKSEDGSFEELWIFPISDQLNDEVSKRKAILAGTDIKPGQTASEDGSQSYEMWTAGNAQMINVKGLPN